MATLFHQGGPTMFWILMLVLPGLALVILHAIFAAQWSRWTSIGVLALVLAIGLYGRMKGRAITDEAVAQLEDTRDREEMRAEGYKESSRPLQFAGVVDGILVIGVLIGEIRRRRRQSSSSQ
jgi:hypothetical protein